MFIQHLATTTHNVVKTERKPRRNIQYRDIAAAVSKTDNLEFLVDVVPKTMTYKEYKRRQDASAKAKSVAAETEAKNGDVREALAGPSGSKTGVNGHAAKAEEPAVPPGPDPAPAAESSADAMEVDQETTKADAERTQVEESDPEEDGPAMQLEMEMRGPRANGSPEVPMEAPRRSSGFTAINGGK